MLSLRQKLSLGFGGLLLIIIIIGVYSVREIAELGAAIDVILRDNYKSVIACEEMKKASERINSGVEFILLGYADRGGKQITENEIAFEKALNIELNNITIPGEGEKAAGLQKLFNDYRTVIKGIRNPNVATEARKKIYLQQLLPLFRQIRNTADEILKMNQQSMLDANERARKKAKDSSRGMYIFLILGIMTAGGFIFFIGRWILQPITRLTLSVEQIKEGNLDLVVKIESQDEMGRLSEAFNEMASNLREFRRSDKRNLIRTLHAAQQTFNSLPDAVAVLNLQGVVDLSTESAGKIFGLKRGVQIKHLSFPWMAGLWNEVIQSGRIAEPEGADAVIQHFVRGEERFFQPKAIPIVDHGRQLTGIILYMMDVTARRQQDDLKRGVISTVSHQLKTPLTSVRMAVHLLLEEKVGPLTEKQVELLLAARDDSERLYKILIDLLDISRIESGRIKMECRAIEPHMLIRDVCESFQKEAIERSINLNCDLPEDLPQVWVDTSRIRHVCGNLLSNAIRYTPACGKITITAAADNSMVHFRISDTGRGIPAEYLPRIFEQFFRGPEQNAETGAGLGLAIVKEIVEAHGGSVAVESVVGRGTTFSFMLRRADQSVTTS
ncbi:MAG: ATP-binding protein [Smithella sp.]